MEVDDIQQASKYSRVNSNAKINSSNIATAGHDESGGGTNNTCQAVVPTTITTTATATTTTSNAVMVNGSGGGEMVVTGSSNRFGRQWHSSRIIRVSRASGGKDRHSKVLTAKGPRDRRVRLSVNTAIQFYDLQDRLGYDQPSKAVEWLINAAADAINELPSLNTSNFPPETPHQLTDDRRVSTNVAEMEVDGLGQMGSKSGCSSNNSDNSKGSGGGLSLSQKEIRNKARERARERTAKEKERDGEPSRVNLVNGSQHLNQHQLNVSSMAPQTSSFTQLLTGRLSNLNENNNGGGSSSPGSGEVVGLFHKHSRGGGGNGNSNSNSNQWLSSISSTTSSMADYFGAGLMSLSSSRMLGNNHHTPPQVMTLTSFGGSETQHQHDQLQQHHEQHFPFVSDHHHLTSGASGNDYNLNFTMSSSTTATPSGFHNRGTLQSNSPSLVMPYLQRFSADGSGLPFFLGSAVPVSSSSPTVENHHHQQFQLSGLQLCYGDNGARQSDHKGKGKN